MSLIGGCLAQLVASEGFKEVPEDLWGVSKRFRGYQEVFGVFRGTVQGCFRDHQVVYGDYYEVSGGPMVFQMDSRGSQGHSEGLQRLHEFSEAFQ